jgi:hypothetical protein
MTFGIGHSGVGVGEVESVVVSAVRFDQRHQEEK